MKLHLPLNLLAALMTSFTGVTLGTATFVGIAGVSVTMSAAYAEDIAFDGTQSDVSSGGSVSYDTATVNASTVLNFKGSGTVTIASLNGDASDAVLKVNRVANAGAALSTLNLTGEGNFNGTIYLYSETVGGSRNNILTLSHAKAAQNATVKMGGYSYNLGASVLKVAVDSSISKLAYDGSSNDKNAAVITGEGTTLTVTGDSSSYGGSLQGTVTVDYTGSGTFTLGSGAKGTALSPHSDSTATLKISNGTLSLCSGNVTWAQKLVMGDNATLKIEDGPSVAGSGSYNAASVSSEGFNFTGETTFGSGVNLTSYWGKNLKFSGVLHAANGFTVSGDANEYSYFNLLNASNNIEGNITLTRSYLSLGISSSGSLGNAAVVTDAENKSQLITYYGTAGEAADVINNSMTGAGHFVAQSGWVHLSDNVALTGGYTVNAGAVLSRTGDITAILGGGRLDAGVAGQTMKVLGISGSGIISATAGAMHFQNETTLDGSVSILVNGTGSITGNVTVDGGRLMYTSMDNVSSVLQNLTLTSGLIDFSGFEEFMDIVGSDALIGKTYDLGANLGDGFVLDGVTADAYTIDNSSGKSVIKFTGSGRVNTDWAAGWHLDSAPSSAVALDATSATMELYGVRASSVQEGFGSVNVVSGTGDLTGVVLIGGYNGANAAGGESKNIDTDIWTYVTGGDFKRIVGGCVSDAWSHSYTRNITGDVHTQMTGGSADFLIGGIYNDANSPVLTGDVYVAVTGDALIRGSVAGGSVSSHTKTNTINGSTFVVVTNVQSSTTADSENGLLSGYIIGGSIFRNNNNSSTVITGGANVTIDLADTAAGNFVKNILGGSFIDASAAGDKGNNTNSVGGDTCVSITAPSGVVFTGNIYGGSYATGNSTSSAKVTGNSSLTLNGGAYSGALYAGSGGEYGSTDGTASMIVKGNVTFKSGSSLNAGNAAGDTSLSLGSDKGTIAFDATDGTNLSGFDIVTMFQDAVFTGKVNLDGVGSLALAGGSGKAVALGGAFSLSAVGVLNLDLTGFGELTDGMTVLSTEGLSNISSVVATFADGVGGLVSVSEDGKGLVYSAKALFLWNGGESGNWNQENVWLDGDAAVTYAENTSVSFADLDGITSSRVQIDTEVAPGSVLVRNADTRYEWTGEGSVSSTVITKDGTGALVLGSATILGEGSSIIVIGGTLAFGYSTALPTEGITWGEGSCLGATNGTTVTVDLGTVTSPAFNFSPETGSTISLTTPSNITLANNIAGAGTVAKTGTGTLTLTGANNGNLVVKEGTVQIGNSSVLNWGAGGSVTLENGTALVLHGKGAHHTIGADLILGLAASDAVSVKWYDATGPNNTDYQYNLTGNVTVNGQVSLTTDSHNYAKEAAFTGTLSGAGTITYSRGAGDGNYNSNGKMVISGDASGFTGTLALDSSNNYSTGLDLFSSVANATVSLTSGTHEKGFASMRVRGDVAVGTLNGTANTWVGAVGGDRTLTVGAGDFNGTITNKGLASSTNTNFSYDESGVLSLTKVGDGTLTLAGTVSYTGLTNVQGGTLALTSTGTTSLTNITLGAAARMTVAGGLSLTSGSALSLDASSSLSVAGAFGGGVYSLTLTGLEGITDEGEYTLISAASGLGTSSATFNWDGYEGDGTLLYTLERSDTALKLLITPAGGVWVWQGTEGLNWSDKNTGVQWGIDGSEAEAAGQTLVFNSTGLGDSSAATVTVSGTVSPASMKVTNGEGTEYVFTAQDDSSRIASGTLVKSGAGKLTMNLNNSGWSGAIAVAGGELVGAVAGSLGSGAVTVTDGKLTLATADVQTGMGMITLEGGSLNLASGEYAALTADNMTWSAGSLILGEQATVTAAKALANGKTVELAAGSVLTISGGNDNAALNLSASGAGTVAVALSSQTFGNNVLNLSTAFQGALAVSSGNFQLNKVTMGADAVLKLTDASVNAEWNGTAGGTFANDIVFAGNHLYATKDVVLSGDLSGTAFAAEQKSTNITLTGGVNMDGQLKISTTTVTVNSSNVIKLADSIDVQNNGKLAFARDFSYSGVISGTAGSMVMANGGTLTLTGANTTLSTLNIAGGATAVLGEGSVWAGALSGAGSLIINNSSDMTLAAGNTAFTGETTLSGTGKVSLSGADSLGMGQITVNNGVLDMGSSDVANTILITGGSLANAGAKTSGVVNVAAAAGAQGNLNTVDLGNVSGSVVDSIVMEDYSRLTGISGNLDMTGKTVTLKLDSGSITVGSTTGAGVIAADSLTLSAATTTISLSNQGVLDLLAANKASSSGVGLVLTTGTLAVDNVKEGGLFSPYLSSLGYAVTGITGGTLNISGNADLSYLVNDTELSDDRDISDYAALDPYKSVGIKDAEMNVRLNGAPEASRNGEGLKVSNLIGSNASLVITNTASDAADNHAVVELIQNVDAGANSYGGTISGDHVDFVKKGTETLTVEGNITGNDSTLSVTDGAIVLNGTGNSLSELELAGGDITLGSENDGETRVTTIDSLSSDAGGGTLTIGEDAHLVLTGQQADAVSDVKIAGEGTLTVGGSDSSSSLTLGTGSALNGVQLHIREGSSLTAAAGSVNKVSGLMGDGSLNLNGAEMTVDATSAYGFEGTLDGTSGILNFQSANGSMQTINGSGNVGYVLNVGEGGALTLTGAATENGDPAQASYQGITVNDGTLNIGSESNPKTQLTLGAGGLSVTGNSTVNIITSSTTVEGLGNPFVTSEGNITLGDNTGSVTLVMSNLDTLVSGDAAELNMELFTTANGIVTLGSDVTLQDLILGSMYENLELTTNESGTSIILTGMAKTDNIFASSSLTDNSSAGAELLWNSRYELEEGSTLRDFYSSVLVSQREGDTAGAARKLAAAAGSTVTSLGIAQRDSLRDQMGWIRNRVAQMGVNPAYVHEDMPYFHMWMQGTGSYAKLDAKGDESGYELTTWGGTVGMDVDINDRITAGAAFTANYGSLTASAADTAEGDLDSYYVNLFARYQSRKWSHLLILTGGWNDATLTRTVGYGTGAYWASGNTTGFGFGAMYELAYDIALNEDRSVILQPLFNASIVTTRMDGYRESGSAGNAGLRVEDQELTTAAVAVGARLSGLIGANVFGREALGEVRVNVSQDMGDRRGEANVGFLADPSYTRPVYGAKVGSTAFQIGAGLSVPVGTQGVIFVDGNADIRSGSSSINGSIGYRYNF